MNICKFENCQNTYYAKGMCRPHYRSVNKEQHQRWLRIKQDPKKHEEYLAYQREIRKKYVIDYKKHVDSVYFAGNREKAIERDDYKCVFCFMTRGEHQTKYGKDLNVHHIDGKGHGVKSKDRNSELSNLLTVCVRCHSLIHNGTL